MSIGSYQITSEASSTGAANSIQALIAMLDQIIAAQLEGFLSTMDEFDEAEIRLAISREKLLELVPHMRLPSPNNRNTTDLREKLFKAASAAIQGTHQWANLFNHPALSESGMEDMRTALVKMSNADGEAIYYLGEVSRIMSDEEKEVPRNSKVAADAEYHDDYKLLALVSYLKAAYLQLMSKDSGTSINMENIIQLRQFVSEAGWSALVQQAIATLAADGITLDSELLAEVLNLAPSEEHG